MNLSTMLACQPLPPLDLTGLDGAELPARGLWLETTLRDVQTGATSIENGFQLGEGLDCATFRAEASDDPYVRYEAALARDPTDTCGASTELYRALADSPFSRPGLMLGLQLWDTLTEGDHIGVMPDDATYTPIDGPDADRVEYASSATRRLVNWWGEVSAAFDCADPEAVWGQVSAEEDAANSDYRIEGPVTFRVGAQSMQMELDLTLTSGDPGFEDGTVVGTARLDRCRVTREIGGSGTMD